MKMVYMLILDSKIAFYIPTAAVLSNWYLVSVG